MSFRIDDKRLLEKYKAIWTKIEDFKNIELYPLTVYDDRYIKNKIRTYGDNVYTNFHGLNVTEDIKKANLLQSFLLIIYFYLKANITCSYIQTTALI